MSRPSFEEINMQMATLVSRRSTCKRLNVGCVITSKDFRKVLSVGYNGNASGLPNTCDSDVPGACGCIHSEANAIINCDSPRSVEKIIFVTALPCPTCAKFMVNLGNVRKVYYMQDYRIKDGLDILSKADIPFARLVTSDERSVAPAQRRVGAWVLETLGPDNAYNASERALRTVEEVVELAQACGVKSEALHKLVDYVLARPMGNAPQEIAGSLVTLYSVAEALGVDAHAALETELERIHLPEVMEKVRRRQSEKREALVGDLEETHEHVPPVP